MSDGVAATSYLGDTGTVGWCFFCPMLSWTDPPLGAVPARLPNPPPLSNSATGASPSAIGSRQRSLDPALLVGVCSGASRTSSCTRCTASSESSESSLCNSRTGSASPACHGHTKGRVAHPPASTLRTASQGQSRGSLQRFPVPHAHHPPSVPRSAFRPPYPRCSRSPACPDRHGNRGW
jgi:hypothetical protein